RAQVLRLVPRVERYSLEVDAGVARCDAGTQRVDQRVAVVELVPQLRKACLVVCRLAVELFGAIPPVADLVARELVGAGLRNVEPLLELRNLDALGLGDIFELRSAHLPLRALLLDRGELLGQRMQTLLELALLRRRALELLVETLNARLRLA